MLAQPKNRVQAIKSKFESLKTESEVLVVRKKSTQLNKQDTNECKDKINGEIIETISSKENSRNDSDSDEWSPKPNSSYLYSKNEVKRSLSETKPTLVRQTSDPCKKLYRSHAFRCDRSQIINQSPKRHGSCNGRSETSDFTLKMGDKKLSKERLKQLGNFLEVQMKKENFCPNTSSNDSIVVGEVNELPDSIPDSQVPKHILDQYAKVLKNKNKAENRQDSMTDSGVSSETEIVEDDKSNKIKKLVSQYEKIDVPQETKVSKANLESMNDLCASSETMKLERKNPHLILTDTLKKALKQPLPPGPPPKKPPRIFAGPSIPESPENNKKDAKKMLEKLEQVLQKREAQVPSQSNNIYDIAETDQTVDKPKEMHYLCTEILDITHRTLTPNNQKDPFSKCFNSLNCAIITNNSTLSLPYTRLSSHNPDSLNICCSNENVDMNNLSTFLSNKCLKCQSNDKTDGFKCHLNCDCKEKKSEFFVKKEHIYDVPFVDKSLSNDNHYGMLNSLKLQGSHSRSMEDLQSRNFDDDQKIYDVPCEVSRPPTPDLIKSDFQRLRDNFENATHKTIIQPINLDERAVDPKPIMSTKIWKSSENVTEDFKKAKRQIEKKFATDVKRYKRNERGSKISLSLPKRESQLDVDRENLNRLMTEIYETVKAACNMDENKPGSFPTDLSDAASEESVTLTRSLTEKRKNYVRRVSSRVAYLDKNVKTRFRHQTSICSYKSEILDNPYSTFRSWKSFRTSQSNLARDKMERHDSTDSKINLTDSSGNMLSIKDMVSDDSLDNLSIDEKTGCVDIDLPFVPRDKGLFNICLLVGLNYMTGEAYVKSVFPSQVQVPPHIENLIFPETISSGTIGEWATETAAQCYSLVLTDERGERAYGYCRRVLPEGATTCLPLCYCLIGKYRAPGFYYKVLQEIESHHGNSEVEINQILQQLFETDFPNPGEQISITYTNVNKDKTRSLGDIHKCKTMPDPRRNESTMNVSVRKDLSGSDSPELTERESETESHELPEYYDLENNNRPRLLSIERPRTRIIKRPLDPRADEDNVSILLDTFGAGLVIKVFGSLLLERKVIVMGDELSVISSCMEALQSALYPFVWQQPLISTIPSQIQRDVLTAPLPILAAMLSDHNPAQIEEGMLIDLTHPSKVLFYQGDESTILPTASYKTLKTSLHMESIKHKDKHEDTKTRNVMISEAFLRFFVDILGDFWKFFADGEIGDSDLGKNGVVFDKEAFIKNSSSKQVQYFLEWFTETAMFNHFIQNMATCYHDLPLPNDYINKDLVDTPLPNFYELFHERVKSRSKTQNQKSDSKLNYKNAVNKKVKMLKTKLRDLVA